jgi:uncharacterized hydrophobic protein (TIGR00271 family)
VLHLRVVSPTGKTDEVLRVLRTQPGTTHLVLLPGAALAPEGDVIEADVAREAADDVLERLGELHIDHEGAITLEQLDTALSDAADAAERAAPGDGADAVVWQELLARTGEDSKLNLTYLAFLSIACLLAAVGVVTDSPVTIVGAMVLGPEFGPLAAISVGLIRRRWDLTRRAMTALVVGFAVAMLVTAVGAALGESAGLFSVEVLRGEHQVDFVYEVGVFSLIVALLAGAAGMLAMTSAKSASLVGVFISVTTVPAAGYAAAAAVLGEWEQCVSSLGQLVVNLIGIVLAAALVLLLRKRAWRESAADRPLPVS